MFNQITTSATAATLDAWRRSENSKQASHAAKWVDEDAVKNGDPGDALSGTRKYEPPESHLSFFSFYRSTEVLKYRSIFVPTFCTFPRAVFVVTAEGSKQQQPGASISENQTHSLRQRYWNEFLIFLVRIHFAIVGGTVASFTPALGIENLSTRNRRNLFLPFRWTIGRK